MSEFRKWDEAIREAALGEVTPLRRLDHFEEAQEASDLHAIYRDLEFVKSAADYLAEILEGYDSQAESPTNTSDTYVVERSLYTAALVAYKRCFDHGKRLRLTPESVFSGDAEELREFHQYFIKVRDAHVVHSVNPFEINRVAAYVEGADRRDPQVEEVGTVHLPRTTDDSYGTRLLASLAEHAMEVVYHRSDAVLDALWARVKSLSQEELLSLKPLVLSLEGGLDVVSKERPWKKPK